MKFCILMALPAVVRALSFNAYDLGFHGIYPTQRYTSFDLSSPSVRITKWDPRCDSEDTYVLLSPHGRSVPNPGPVILDARGNLVWMDDRFGKTMNFQVQAYKGEDYLTFWSGTSEGPHSNGSYYMLDSSYEIAHRISAVGFEGGDLHEFKITENGTALITIYQNVKIDCTDLGFDDLCWVNDCLLQEIDIETGNLMFQWRASDHVPLRNSWKERGNDGRTEATAYDFFHINSIDKDHLGNYLISSRHTHAVLCISPTGSILWQVGGRENSFTDLSSGAATNFAWQHHANWQSNNTLTLFDNNGNSVFHHRAGFSRGVLLSLDLENMTATLLQTYIHSKKILAISQGSTQLLPGNGHVLVGWGNTPAYTEFTNEGEVLCDMHFAASAFFELVDLGFVKSYRAFKSHWVGKPRSPPDIKIENRRVFVSWNGATEVVAWRVEIAGDEEGGFVAVNELPKEGFETSFELWDEVMDVFVRVAALDARGKVLGYSRVADPASIQTVSSLEILVLVLGCQIAGTALLVWKYQHSLSRKFSKVLRYTRRRNGNQDYELLNGEEFYHG